VDGISDVSEPLARKAGGGVLISKSDILKEDDHIGVYEDDEMLGDDFKAEVIPTTEMFRIDAYHDATFAPRGEDGRTEVCYIIQLNGAAVDNNTVKITGVAASTTESEYVGGSICCKKVDVIRVKMLFLGIAVAFTTSYIDSTAALQLAKNPKKMGATRHLGVRWHLVRYHIHAKNLELKYAISEDKLADLGAKLLARKK
jgi:hypothetical protein